MKKITSLIIIAFFIIAVPASSLAGTVLGDIIKAYKTYQEVNMTLWLLGDIGAEKRFGKELQFWLRLSTKQEKDPKINAYVKNIFNSLTPHFNSHGLNFDVRVIKNSSANAFAIPGGHIYVHTGLLDMVKSDDELATVLAHELAHAERRHSLKNFRASTAAVALLNAAVKNRKDRETWGALLNILAMMKFSRKQEDEADDIGQMRMAKAGFNPAAQVTLWEKFLKKHGDTKGLQRYLSSHPPSSKRIENARNNLKKMNIEQKSIFANTRNLMSAEKVNILKNPGFEKTDKNNQIANWHLERGKARLSEKKVKSGRYSIELLSEQRMERTRVLSDFIPVKPDSDFIITGWLASEDGSQNAAIGIELYDAKKRLRDRVWTVRESDKVPPQGANFEARLKNSDKKRIFARNIAYMKVLLQSGLISKGSVWFDNFRLRPAAAKDPVNLIADGSFENTTQNALPEAVKSASENISSDFNRAQSGFASLLIKGTGKKQSLSFQLIPVKNLNKNKRFAGSFYFMGNDLIKGSLLIQLLNSDGKPINKKDFEVKFETSKNKWVGTSFSFKPAQFSKKPGQARVIQIKLVTELKQNQKMWLDNFVIR